MSRDLGRDVPDLDKFYTRKLWVDFSISMACNSKFGVVLPNFFVVKKYVRFVLHDLLMTDQNRENWFKLANTD